jgi:ribosomal protein L37AE/L43A
MEANRAAVQWAPRVHRDKIHRLYQIDAMGIHDEDLIDDVGYALLARCRSFMAAVEASQGRARCACCGGAIPHGRGREEVLHCRTCRWETTWAAYFRTFQHKQMSGGDEVVTLFREFSQRFPTAKTPQEKMLLIDALIHGFHWSLATGPRRPVAVNLIEGTMHQVVDFLDRLSYGERSTPGTRESRLAWRQQINHAAAAWGDERLHRPEE